MVRKCLGMTQILLLLTRSATFWYFCSADQGLLILSLTFFAIKSVTLMQFKADIKRTILNDPPTHLFLQRAWHVWIVQYMLKDFSLSIFIIIIFFFYRTQNFRKATDAIDLFAQSSFTKLSLAKIVQRMNWKDSLL